MKLPSAHLLICILIAPNLYQDDATLPVRTVPGEFSDGVVREYIKMSESVYKVIELVGSSPDGWEAATQNAVSKAAESLRDLRIVEVAKLDAKIEEGKIVMYRSRVKLSFKFEK